MTASKAADRAQELHDKVEQLARELNTDATTHSEAVEITKRIVRDNLRSDTAGDGSALWGACALFVAAFKQSMPGTDGGEIRGIGMKLTTLLKAARVNIRDFLDHVDLLVDEDAERRGLRQCVNSMKEQFVITEIVYRKFSGIWERRHSVLGLSEASGPGHVAGARFDDLRRFTWLLYLLCRQNLQHERGERADMASSYFLLLSCLDFSMRHGAIPAIDPAAFEGASAYAEADAAAVLAALNGDDAASASDPRTVLSAHIAGAAALRPLHVEKFGPVVRELAGSLLESKVLSAQRPQGAGGAAHDGLFDPSVLKVNLVSMEQRYEALCLDITVLDGRYVLHQELSAIIGTPSKLTAARQPRPEVPPSAARDLFRDLNRNATWGVWSTMGGDAHPPPPQSPTRVGISASPAVTPVAAYAGPNAVRTPLRRPRAAGSERSPPPPTPMTASIGNMQWAQGLDSAAAAPAGELLAALKACKEDPTKAIASRIDEVFDKILASRYASSIPVAPAADAAADAAGAAAAAAGGAAAGATSFVEEKDQQPPGGEGAAAKGGERKDPQARRGGAVVLPSPLDALQKERRRVTALYYAVLGSLVESETRRLRVSDHSAFLMNDKFHRAVLACCCEVVLKTASLVTLTYPHSLSYFDLTPFDFQKVIESFVRAAPSMPAVLKRHLGDLHDQILLKDAWDRSSPLLELLDGQREEGPWPLSEVLETAQGRRSRSARLRTLEFFFRRLLAAAARRLHDVTERLELGGAIVDQAWTLVKYCLYNHHHLVVNRHVDTIMLCSVYATAKISEARPEVTFKRILDAYRSQHHSSNGRAVSVLKNIRASPPRAGGPAKQLHIIDFYNRIFIGSVKSYVLQFQNMQEQAAAAGNIRNADDATAYAMSLQGSQQEPPQRAGQPPMSPPSRRVASAHSSPLRGAASTMPPLPGAAQHSSMPHPGALRSPQRVRSSNVFVSTPGRGGPASSLALTPRTRALYAFGESPAKDLLLINNAVNKRRMAQPPPAPVLDNAGEEEAGSTGRKRRMVKRHPILRS